MNTPSDSLPRPRQTGTIVVWILRILVALVFAAAGIAKLVGVSMLVAEFDKIGVGQWLRYVTGLIEVVGAILVLLPATPFLGALLLLCVCTGAFVAQAGPLHGDIVHVLILGFLVALVGWITRPLSMRKAQ